jgi:hypothetical protein
METVYIETTIVSYLAADPSRDIVTAGQQQATRDWWQFRRESFQCVISDETLAEAARGDRRMAQRRLTLLAGLPILTVTVEVENLAVEFMRTRALPVAARSDAIHLAAASCRAIDYLLTWNLRHLANARILRRLEQEAVRRGWKLPTVCTPMELMGDSTNE